MSQTASPYGFLSYASADREPALAVADALDAAGIRVWVDRRSIAGGSSWNAEIVRGIQECAVLMLLTSPAAVGSRNVQRELQLAVEFDRPVLPLRIEPAEFPTEMRYALAGVQWVDLLDRPAEAWLVDVRRALTHLGIEPAVPAPHVPPAGSRPATAAASPRSNLPISLTSFVGRTRELGEVRRLLGETRLLTLSGAGGVGKTRLALEAARHLTDSYPEGIWLVELAALSDPAALPAAVAAALGIQDEPGRPLLETVLDALQPRRLLLILDNCEHLIAAAAQLADRLLRACPDLGVLATSREALGIAGELTWLVPSLPLPADAAPASDSDAVRLFVERAAAASPGFALSDDALPAVAEICRRLDGIPLAIELAAARVKALSVEQLAARLTDRFRLLTGGSRTALPRQQTLRAAIDWSYDLLSEPERILLQRLSTFAGGWDLEAAEAVCAGDGIAPEDVLDLLVGLMDKSLVQVGDGAGGERRYRLLETVRQYAREKLLDAGGAAAVRGRHRDWYVALAEEAEPHLETAAHDRWVARLEQEQENLRAALEWSVAAAEAEPALRLTGPLNLYWTHTGRSKEGLAWLDEAFTIEGTVAPRVRARALYALRLLGTVTADVRPGVGEEMLALYRELDDPRGISRALIGLAIDASREGDVARADALLNEALILARRAGDLWIEANVLHQLAHLRERHHGAEHAMPVFEESLACFRRTGMSTYTLLLLGDAAVSAQMVGDAMRASEREEEALAMLDAAGERGPVPTALMRLGEVAHLRGDYGRAIQLLERSATLARDRGARAPATEAMAHLCTSLLASGDHTRAARALRDALVLRPDLSQFFQRPGDLVALAAALAAARPDPYEAARLLGAAQTQRDRAHANAWPAVAQVVERAIQQVRSILDEDAFAVAYAEGRALSFDEAIALALKQTAASPSS